MNWKRYLPPALTVLLILLGASMPWLAAQIQDAGIRKFQESAELNSVSLTLQKENSLKTVLQMAASQEYTLFPWSEDTTMTAQQAGEQALEAVRQMELYGLLPVDSAVLLEETAEQAAYPCLLVAEDGGSALVWECCWTGENVSVCSMLLDDVTGKAVFLSVGSDLADAGWAEYSYTIYEGEHIQDGEYIWLRLEQWLAFLQTYCGAAVEVCDVRSGLTDYGEPVYRFFLSFDFEDGTGPCESELCFYGDITLFNLSSCVFMGNFLIYPET